MATEQERLDRLLDSANIDGSVFQQVLDMDEDGENDFSKSIVYDFFDQAVQTFEDMDNAFLEKDLKKLSDLGHFLKGSSATLGMTKVRNECEIIQNLGLKKDETGNTDVPDENVSLEKLKRHIRVTKMEFEKVEIEFRRFYGE